MPKYAKADILLATDIGIPKGSLSTSNLLKNKITLRDRANKSAKNIIRKDRLSASKHKHIRKLNGNSTNVKISIES